MFERGKDNEPYLPAQDGWFFSFPATIMGVVAQVCDCPRDGAMDYYLAFMFDYPDDETVLVPALHGDDLVTWLGCSGFPEIELVGGYDVVIGHPCVITIQDHKPYPRIVGVAPDDEYDLFYDVEGAVHRFEV